MVKMKLTKSVDVDIQESGTDIDLVIKIAGGVPLKAVSLRSYNGKISVVRWMHADRNHTGHPDIFNYDAHGRVEDIFKD